MHFYNYLKNLKGLDAFKIVTGNWNRQSAYDQFKDYYSSHSNVNIVWCANDYMALGVVKAIAELDLRRKIVVGGVDWDKERILKTVRWPLSKATRVRHCWNGIIRTATSIR